MVHIFILIPFTIAILSKFKLKQNRMKTTLNHALIIPIKNNRQILMKPFRKRLQTAFKLRFFNKKRLLYSQIYSFGSHKRKKVTLKKKFCMFEVKICLYFDTKTAHFVNINLLFAEFNLEFFSAKKVFVNVAFLKNF